MSDTVTTPMPTVADVGLSQTTGTTAQTGTSGTTTAGATTTGATKRKTSLIPRSLIQKIATGRIASAKLKERNWTSDQMPVTNLDNTLDDAEKTVKSSSANKTALTPNSSSGKSIKQEARKSLGNLKGLLIHEYGRKEAISYYGNYGMEKVGTTYTLPNKTPETLLSLDKLISELSKGEIVSSEYNVKYWTDLRNSLQTQLDNSTSGKGAYSVDVAKTTTLKSQLDDYLNIIVNMIYVHVPKDQVAATLREFGFQKERYAA